MKIIDKVKQAFNKIEDELIVVEEKIEEEVLGIESKLDSLHLYHLNSTKPQNDPQV